MDNTSSENRICRQCEILSELPKDVTSYAKKLYDLLPKKERADEGLMQDRISVCKECERREMSTCLECGCYIEIRVMKKASRCPKRKW